MKFLLKILIIANIAVLDKCSGLAEIGQFVIDDSDKDLSERYGLIFSGFDEVLPGNGEVAQIPSLENISASQFSKIGNKFSNIYGRLCILYHLKTLNESSLSLLFQQVSILQNQKSSWAPTIIAQFSVADSKIAFENALEILNKLIKKQESNWTFPIGEGFYIVIRNMLSTPSTAPATWNIFEVYTIKNATILQNVQTSLNYYTLLKKDARRSDFRKQVFVAVSMDVHGYELATDFVDDNSTDRFLGGFEVKFYRYLMDALNFTEKALRGKSYVREGPGGTLTGMAVPVNKEEADICVSSTEFLEYRISGPDGFSYLLPTFKLGMKAYFKQPAASSIRDVFTSAFSLQLWISLLGLWVFICCSMHLAYFIYFKEESYKELSSNDVTMSDEISIWGFGAMCQQGWYFTPKFIGTRIIFFFGWFTGFMCYIAYSAQLVSILSVEVIPIKSFEDLLRDKFFLYNDNHIPTTKYFVKGLQERGIIPTFAENLRNVDIEQTFVGMLKAKAAMISISDSLFPILTTIGLSEEFICGTVSEVGMGGRSVIMSMFVKRASPTRSIFNTKILQMLERGVNHRILQDYLLATSVQCLKSGNSGQNNPLSSKDVFTAYAILLSGFLLSSAIVVAEQLFRRMWRKVPFLGQYGGTLGDRMMEIDVGTQISNKSNENCPNNIFDLYQMTKRSEKSGVRTDKVYGGGSWDKLMY